MTALERHDDPQCSCGNTRLRYGGGLVCTHCDGNSRHVQNAICTKCVALARAV